MTNLITPKSPGLVAPNGAPIGSRAVAPSPNPEMVIPQVGAFMESQGVFTLPVSVKVKNAVGEHAVPALGFPVPALVRLMQVLMDGGKAVMHLTNKFEESQKQCAELGKLAAKRRDMISAHIENAKAYKKRIAILEREVSRCASVFDDYARMHHEAGKTYKATINRNHAEDARKALGKERVSP